ncbi:MAG: hypothetical protein HY952_05210, partial [Elusimicrobia bacterium]|nr:hypothetical protein [Elusimicrobiota bacterium]
MTYPKARSKGRTAALAAAAALCLGAPAAAGEVAAVLSSDSGPYGEAFAGFRGGLGESFDIYDLSKPGTETPEDATHVAAFGAKASAREYPPGTHLVSVLTPVSGKGRLWHEMSML